MCLICYMIKNHMKNKLVILLILLFVLVSCSNNNSNLRLNESEIFFSETLASISSDSYDDNIFYVGTEDGVVYVYNSETQKIDTIQTEFDRIYKVVKEIREGGETVYWIGTRNMGLFCCKLKGDSLSVNKENGRYYIPVSKKSTKYSVYDISIQKSGIYLATSHGLFKIPKKTEKNDTTLIILAPESYKPNPEHIRPVVFGNIQNYENKYLFCSSDSGLIKLDLATDKVSRYLSNCKIRNVVIRHGDIFSLTGDRVIITDKNGVLQKNIKLGNPAQIYYYDEIERVNYFVNDYQIQLVEDPELYDSKYYKQVKTKRPIRTICHNIMVNDAKHRQSLLITRNSILRVGHHQNIFNSYGNLKLACVDGDKVYYLVDTKLYCQKANEKIAYPIKDITGGTKDVCYMEVLNDVLYYVDSDNNIFKASLHSNYLFNSIFSWDREIRQNPEKMKSVTAIGKDEKNIYVGVRDGFRNVADIDTDIKLIGDTSNQLIQDPYITTFANNKDKTILGTLNDGVFVGKDNSFTRLKDSDKYSFIRDIKIPTNNMDSVYILTNRYMYILHNLSLAESKRISSYNKLLIIDRNNMYGLKNFGLTELNSGINYFVDIQFNVNACLVLDGKIYAASPNGVYVFDSSLNKKGGVEKEYYRVKFIQKDYFSRANIAILVILIIMTIVILWIIDRYKMSRRAILAIKDGLRLRLDELSTVREYLDDESIEQLDGLVSEVDSIDIAGKKDAMSDLRKISMKIMTLTVKVPAILTQILQDQVSRIKKCNKKEAANYIKNTNDALRNHTLLRLREQIRTNCLLLDEIRVTKEKLADIRAMVNSAPEIFGDIVKAINPLFMTLKAPEEKLADIENKLKDINIASYREKIIEYIKVREEQCNSITARAEGDSAYSVISDTIKEQCEVIVQSIDKLNITEAMRAVIDVDKQLNIIEIINSIKEQLSGYEKINDAYENKKQDIMSSISTGKYAVNIYDKKKDNKEFDHIKNELEKASSAIKESVNNLYCELANSPEKELLKVIGLNLKDAEDGHQFLSPTVLAILVAGTDIPIGKFNRLLKVNEQSIRRVRRQLVQQLEQHRKEIEDYIKDNKTWFSILLLRLIE